MTATVVRANLLTPRSDEVFVPTMEEFLELKIDVLKLADELRQLMGAK